MKDNWGTERDRRVGFYPIEKINKGEKQMSWSVTTNLVSKSNAKAAIALLELSGDQIHSAWAVDQLETAKNAAREIIKGIPGPYLIINVSGHANGAGWNKKDAYANDTINVSVSQVCQEDLKHYNTLNELETDEEQKSHPENPDNIAY